MTTLHHGPVVAPPSGSGAVSVEGVTSIYSGTRDSSGATFVSVNGRPLNTRTDLRKASSTAFEWGYEGRGGPAQLALAILADHFADDERARRYYEQFLRRVIRGLPRSWSLTGPEIDAALPDGAC